MNQLGLLPLLAAETKTLAKPVTVMGLSFPNRIGLAAGLDKNADHIQALSQLGFGFIEVGTLTPRPQPGNPKPRMFRLRKHQAIINRMGFNNKGIDHALAQVSRCRAKGFRGIIGINIGKNFDTPVERAVDDYMECLRKSYRHADYVTVNLSSPNTPGLRKLQFGDELSALLKALKQEQHKLTKEHGRYVPLALKLAPDLETDEVAILCQQINQQSLDAVIATNTTISREAIGDSPYVDEAGGLSGAPLSQQATQIVSLLRQGLDPDIALIGVGGIMSAADANAKTQAGADLLQLYSGFIYAGPTLIEDCLRALEVQ